jgi:hypothetical protein
MTLDYKILGQLYYGPEIDVIPGEPGTGGYGYYGANIGGQGTPDSYVEITEPQILYTVPAATETTITSIYVTNHDSVQRTYDLAIVPAGETLGLKHHIRWDMPVGSSDFDLTTAKLTLSAGDRVYVFPSTINKVGFTAFGVEKS